MPPLFFAIALSLAAPQAPPALAGANPALAKVCAQILRAAQQRDFAVLMPLLDSRVDINSHESLERRGVLTLLQTWPEDFGPPFWQDLRDVVEAGVADRDDNYIWRRPGTVLQFVKAREGVRIHAIVRDEKPRTKVMPVDAALSESGLAAVRAQIERAIARRDVNLLLPILGPRIAVNNTDNRLTPRELIAAQKACVGDACSDFWRDLHDAISLGMARDEQENVVAPYVPVKTPGDAEAFAITGGRVALRSAPDAHAPAIEWLSYDLVTVDLASEWEDRSRPVRIGGFEYGWRRVLAPSGKTGWVSAKYARGGGDTNLWFQRIDGKWKLIAMAGGD